MKKLLRGRGLVERGGSLRKGEASKVFHQFSLSKACFHYYSKTFFLPSKYSRLLLSIDLFFHVLYFLPENDIL